jgi:hypothetical protein
LKIGTRTAAAAAPFCRMDISLVFVNLATGYEEHLFNKISSDIISSDIAVFETSDLNPNVMIEIGVALTREIKVLPIRSHSQLIA